MTAPDGRAAQYVNIDRTLVGALHSAHQLAERCGLSGSPPEPQGRALSTYERRLCGLAFLAPDIQAAILVGRQPISLNLKRLIAISIPTSWEAQRALFEMSLAG